MRALGLDLGTVRIGVAVSDPDGILASPRATVARHPDRADDHAEIAALATELEVVHVVVGLPLSMDGSWGPAARAAQDEAEALAAVLAVPVSLHDERLSTVQASGALRRSGTRGRRQRRVIDQSAAAVILQSWLDQRALRESTR